MPQYAVYETDKIVNVIIAEDKASAEEFSEMNAIESIDGAPWIDWYLVDGFWVSPKPYPSWNLNDEYEWEAPTSKPNDGALYLWDEESLSWIKNGGTE